MLTEEQYGFTAARPDDLSIQPPPIHFEYEYGKCQSLGIRSTVHVLHGGPCRGTAGHSTWSSLSCPASNYWTWDAVRLCPCHDMTKKKSNRIMLLDFFFAMSWQRQSLTASQVQCSLTGQLNELQVAHLSYRVHICCSWRECFSI